MKPFTESELDEIEANAWRGCLVFIATAAVLYAFCYMANTETAE